ncbi:putative LARGE xylosyl- and glucuronyltransferase 2 [Nannochloris sp. 'desiccata']|nr:hypothetical protein KSW81_006887 [Chlorella desiccata (nom. nud.)]KAH7622024.1 putative LARGE xylosyl- and glucuronyltransferase 2 [Chlorella desiccata (nom. nud.)]
MEGKARPKSVALKMLLALVLCIALFVISTVGEVTWQTASPRVVFHSPPGTEKSERKLMGSVPVGPGDRSCRRANIKEEDELPNLVSVQKWTSSKERPRESISLVTQLSMDRLPALENQCITWPDHLVAVVYIPMVGNSSGGPPLLPLFRHTSLEDIIRGIDSFHNFMETTAACAFHVELVGQFVAPGIFPGPYPINSLRNRALNLCPTDLIIPVDADFVATPMLGLPGPGYRDRAVYSQMESMAAKRQALVLPSLELTNKWQDLTLARNVARDVVIAGKTIARRALKGNKMASYRAPDDSFLRDISNITRWAGNISPSLYQVSLDPRAEPNVLLSLATVPWFDERFVDSCGGASTWFSHLEASNFSFLVHPYGFVMHVPHARTPPLSQYMEVQRKLRQSRMESMRMHAVEEIKAGTYAPVLRDCPSAENAEGEEEEEQRQDGGEVFQEEQHQQIEQQPQQQQEKASSEKKNSVLNSEEDGQEKEHQKRLKSNKKDSKSSSKASRKHSPQ